MARRPKKQRRSGVRWRRLKVLLAFLLYAPLALYARDRPVLVAASLAASALLMLLVAVGWRWRRRRKRLRRTRTLVGLLALTPGDFEVAIGELFRSLGYQRLRRVGGAGDLGVDLEGYDPDGRAVIVQCKRYASQNRIGSPAIQSFLGMVVHHGAERGIFVTTSGYTELALTLARDAAVPITLIDGPEISRLTAYAQEHNGFW